MYLKSKGVFFLDFKEHGFYEIEERIRERRKAIMDLLDELYCMDTVVETIINPPGSENPMSITLKSEPVYDILRQIDEHRKAISDLFVEMKMLTAAVESNINEKLRAAATLSESPIIAMDAAVITREITEKEEQSHG